MPIIQQPVFLGYADRIAGQYRLLKDAMLAMAAGTAYFEQLTVTGDPDVEIPMLAPARNQDVAVTATDAATLAVKAMPKFTALITAMETHLTTQTVDSTISTWDAYCSDEGIRVSDYTNKVYYARHGKYMLARNVFCEEEKVFATCSISPSGTIQFVDGLNFGLGYNSDKADGNNFAGAQLQAILSTDVIGIDIEIVGRGETGATRRLSTTGSLIAGPSGTRIPIIPASGRFVDVTGVNLLSGGVSGESFQLVNIVERDTTL